MIMPGFYFYGNQGGASKRPLAAGRVTPFIYRTSLDDSRAWREGFVRTFLERDIPQPGHHHTIGCHAAFLGPCSPTATG
ncbi:MAG: hypothetical protein U5K27_02270 [Desulfotignum sp.]|nr:hypothetical protein [Desulfotignum sp.]